VRADNGWLYDNRYWDAYSGPYFRKNDFLVLLSIIPEICILHYIKDSTSQKPNIIFQGIINDSLLLNEAMLDVEKYRIAYCKKAGIDSTRNIEADLIEYQNSSKEAKCKYDDGTMKFLYKPLKGIALLQKQFPNLHNTN
jgi:hypothetical protein